jgi:hypothetical protein
MPSPHSQEGSQNVPPMMNSCLPGRPKRRRLGYIPPCLPSRAELPPLGLDWLHEIKHASLEMRASTAAVLRQSEHDQPPSSDRLTSHRETASAPFRVLPLRKAKPPVRFS